MTQEELEYNKRCAEFLTIKEELKNELSAYPKQQYSPLCSYANAAYQMEHDDFPLLTVWDYCKFHSDWNWIMEVVKAIKIKIGNPTTVTIACFNGDINKALMSAKQEAVIQAINQFLIWYNENK